MLMLEINSTLVLVTIASFLCMIFVLNKMLYKPLLTHMDARDAQITSADDGEKDILEKIAQIDAQREQILQDASKEAAQIRSEALLQAQEKADALINQTKEKIAKDYNKFQTQLSKEKAKLDEDLQEQMPLFKASLKKKMATI